MSGGNEPKAKEIVCTRQIPLEGAYTLETAGTSRLWKVVHENYAICTVTDGSARVRYRQREYEIPVGSTFLVEPGEAHATTRVIASGGFEVVFIPAAIVPDILEEDSFRLPHLQVFKTCRADLREPLRHAFAMLRAKADEEAVRQQFSLAIHHLLSYADEKSAGIAARNTIRVRKAGQLMREAYDATPWQPVRIAAIANELGMSYAHLVRSFSREVGIAPYQYVQKLRLGRLLSVLRAGPGDGLHSLVDVAMRLGFTDASHLYRCVVREYGTTPGQFARDLNEKWANGRHGAASCKAAHETVFTALSLDSGQ